MSEPQERALIGWAAIDALFSKPRGTMSRHARQMEKDGAIFYMNVGRPPREMVHAFPSVLKRWAPLRLKQKNRPRGRPPKKKKPE